jgi:hypothetical protein
MSSATIVLTYWFVIFAVVYFAVYYVVPPPRLRLAILALGCVTFHVEYAGPAGVIPIIVLAVLTSGCACTRQKHLCALGIAVSVLALVVCRLGGSRHGLARRIVNGLVAFAICGLWHGAAWNFALRGLYHGAGLAVSGTYARAPGRPGSVRALVLARMPLLSGAVTLLCVCIGWLLFYPADRALRMFVPLFRSA